MPDLSIIIASWNAKDYLAGCLRSLGETNDGLDLEVIVVDNASSDRSAEMVERDFPDVRLIRSERNLGFAGANNLGIREAQGRYLCLINSDVVVLPGCLRALMALMDRDPSIGLAGPRVLNADGTLQPSCSRFPNFRATLCRALALDSLFPRSRRLSGSYLRFWAHDSERRVDAVSGCFWIVRREAIDDTGLLDEDFFFYAEDIDWCRRFHDARWQVVFSPAAEAIHHGGGSSANDPVRFFIESQRANLRYWEKHHGAAGRRLYGVLIVLHLTIRLCGHAIAWAARPSRRPADAAKLRRSLDCLKWMFSRSDAPTADGSNSIKETA